MRRNQIRKGMVMLATSETPVACWEFEGDILVLHHPTTISTKYQAMGQQRRHTHTSIRVEFFLTGRLCTCVQDQGSYCS